MPFVPVRNQGEPPTNEDLVEWLGRMVSGVLDNPPVGYIKGNPLAVDAPVAGHGDDAWRRDFDDDCYLDAYGRRVPPPRLRAGAERIEPERPDSNRHKPRPVKWLVHGALFGDPKKFQMAYETKDGKEGFANLGRGFLKTGNEKTNVYNWSLPEGLLCPGRSAWCASCYATGSSESYLNTVTAPNVLRMRAFALYPKEWEEEMTAECLHYGALCPIRLHVSGDFFNAQYTEAWVRIAKACLAENPTVRLWAYTRSWMVGRDPKTGKVSSDPKVNSKSTAALRAALEELRSLPNMTLFGSFDPSMPTPPDDWNWAGIYADPRAALYASAKHRRPSDPIICPEIVGTEDDWRRISAGQRVKLDADGFPVRGNCRKCGWCWFKGPGPALPTMVLQDRDRALHNKGIMFTRSPLRDVWFPHHGAFTELPKPGSISWPRRMPTEEEAYRYSIERNGGGQGVPAKYGTTNTHLWKIEDHLKVAARNARQFSDRSTAKFYEQEFQTLRGMMKKAFGQTKKALDRLRVVGRRFTGR